MARCVTVGGDSYALGTPRLSVDLEVVDVSLCGVVTRSRKEMASMTGDQPEARRQLVNRRGDGTGEVITVGYGTGRAGGPLAREPHQRGMRIAGHRGSVPRS